MIRALLLTLALAAPAEARCRLALALGMDISSSVNSWEYELQLYGLAAAFRDEAVIEAILSVPGQHVLVLPYEWSGQMQQDAIGGWTRLSSAEEIAALADRLSAHTRRYQNFSTGIGTALEYAIRQFDRLPERCDRHVIDLSGDGVDNDGRTAPELHPRLIAAGITVNALVIAGGDPDPVSYYADQVIVGPDAFHLIARNGFEDYPELIKGKLIRELNPPLLIGEAAEEEPAPTR
ncbi:DUF1194 domain-containing protein [Pontivivens ytuae]|uniref:DUF1194 domain-containing protein n=1 Tax=Pontivivens ytuae TaxID=2789856 RepID=A0A7S9LTI8_9RHOB|nr:DUF1194 domain-containing protein [Pontivivens ytuae]QPH54972.1 DUF1194 domain-containing protein [Pontivivens ytuae]